MDFVSKEINVRYLSSLVVSLTFNVVFLFCGCSIVNLSIFLPLYSSGVWDPLLFMFSVAIPLLVTRSFYAHLKASDIAFCKARDFFQILVDQRNFLFSLTLIILGSLQAFTVTRLMGYCERSAFILQYGGFVGFSFAFYAISQNLLTTTFENKPVSLFGIFIDAVSQNVLRTLGRIVYFYLLCMLLNVLAGLGYAFPFPNASVGFINFDLSLLMEMYVVGFFIFSTWSASLSVLQNAITKSLSPIENDDSHLMVVSEYLISSNANGLKFHLLLGRLADSIAVDAKTREKVFTITDINGQASLWLQLNESCLKILTTFITGLNKANKQLTTEHFSMNATPNLFEHQSMPPVFQETAPVKARNHGGSLVSVLHHLVLEASDSFSRLPIFRYFMREIPFAPTWRLLSSGGTNQVVDIWSTTQESHQTGQAVIWATEILGILTLSSYAEDRLGTVQSSLGRILSTIDESLEVMELHFNSVGLSLSYGGLTASKFGTHCQIPSSTVHEKENARTIGAYKYASDINLPWRIHATLRWALVSCVRRFGDHLRAVQMDVKHKRRIQHMWEAMAESRDEH